MGKTQQVKPLEGNERKADVIYQTFKNFMLSISELKLGCPTNHMIQEMAQFNPKFATAFFRHHKQYGEIKLILILFLYWAVVTHVAHEDSQV